MKLPYRENAFIPPPKLKDYLLSETHPIGKAKSKFFRGAGFNEMNLDMLEQGLLNMALAEDVIEVGSSPHGTKYILDGPVLTPTGRIVHIRTVWIIDTGQDRPRFVTAFPA